MERRCLAGSPWAVQACVDLSLLGVSAGIVFRFCCEEGEPYFYRFISCLKKILWTIDDGQGTMDDGR